MIIDIDRSVADSLVAGAQVDNIVVGLSDIARAVRRGDHVVVSDYYSLSVFCSCELLEESVRRLYERLLRKVSSMHSLKMSLYVTVKIVDSGATCSFRAVDGRHEITMPISFLAQDHNLNRTILLAENLDDCCFFQWLGQYYISKKSLDTLKISCKKTGGGGDTTRQEYVNIATEERRFCLCFLDGDCSYPLSAVGETARKVIREHERIMPSLCAYHVIRCRDVENLVPMALLDALPRRSQQIDDGIAFFKSLPDHLFNEIAKCADIKKGLTRSKLLSKNGPFRDFWDKCAGELIDFGFDVECKHGEDCDSCGGACTCYITPNFGDFFPRIVRLIDRNLSPSDVDVSSYYDSLWGEIGGFVAGWCCGHEPMTGI